MLKLQQPIFLRYRPIKLASQIYFDFVAYKEQLFRLWRVLILVICFSTGLVLIELIRPYLVEMSADDVISS